MATHRKSVGVTSAQLEDDDAFVYVFDRRDKDVPEVKIPTGGLWSYDDFVKRVREVGFCAGFGLFTNNSV